MSTTDDGYWGVFTHELAHQWWGQLAQPASLDDRWMVESFAEMYACMAVAKIHEDARICLDERENTRKLLEGNPPALADHRVSASLVEAYRGGPRGLVVYQYGPYVLQQMLRPRLGNDSFFLALDHLLREHPREPITNERLQAAFEAVSGRDLDDFFDFWVRQGIIPSVDVEVTIHRSAVEIRGTSDVPFGAFDLPVLLTDTTVGRQHIAMLEIVDGEGRVEVPGDYRRGVEVQVDPADRTLLKRVRLTQVQGD